MGTVVNFKNMIKWWLCFIVQFDVDIFVIRLQVLAVFNYEYFATMIILQVLFIIQVWFVCWLIDWLSDWLIWLQKIQEHTKNGINNSTESYMFNWQKKGIEINWGREKLSIKSNIYQLKMENTNKKQPTTYKWIRYILQRLKFKIKKKEFLTRVANDAGSRDRSLLLIGHFLLLL